ncbi:MAG: hypothetical protein U0271_24170 [Polyangiaceae bacterium]
MSLHSTDARLLRRPRGPLVVAGLPALLGLGFGLVGLLTGTFALAVPGFILAPLSVLAIVFAVVNNRSSDMEPVPGALTADRNGLYRDGALVVRRDAIGAGLVSGSAPADVHLVGARGQRDVHVRTKDADEANALLAALELDAAHATATLELASLAITWTVRQQLTRLVAPFFVSLAFLFGSIVTGSPPLVALAAASVFASMAVIVYSQTAKTRVDIGSDGVLVRWLNVTRFTPFTSVRDVGTYSADSGGKFYVGVELVLESGETERIPCGQEGWTSNDPAQIVSRIREALERHRAGEQPAPNTVLERAGRDHGDWLRALRALGAGANLDPRTAPVDVANLLDVAEDATAAPETRAAAAVAAVSSSVTTLASACGVQPRRPRRRGCGWPFSASRATPRTTKRSPRPCPSSRPTTARPSTEPTRCRDRATGRCSRPALGTWSTSVRPRTCGRCEPSR